MDHSDNDKRFCVYIHKNQDGEVVYVGSGTIGRAYQLYHESRRGRKYKEYVLSNGKLNVEILYEGLSLKEARAIEKSEYLNLSNNCKLLNTSTPSTYKSIPHDVFRNCFRYDEDSPSCLTRTQGDGKGRYNKVGEPAGSIHKTSGYYRVWFEGSSFQVSRVVWSMFNGDIPFGFVVDHINGNTTDNKIDNLRLVSIAENARNKSKKKVSRSVIINGEVLIKDLPTGITFCKKDLNLVAHVSDALEQDTRGESKTTTRCFKIANKGTIDSLLSDAIAWREAQIRLMNELGAGYTERHGT